jgi:hypothetical protein
MKNPTSKSRRPKIKKPSPRQFALIAFGGSGWTSPFGRTMTINLQAPAVGSCRPQGGMNCLTVGVAAGGLVRSCDPAAQAGTPTACN